MKADDPKLSIQEKYAEIAKKSLIRVQYSCSGNSTGYEESDSTNYRTGIVEDIPKITELLAGYNLPYSDIVPGKQNFIVAEIDNEIIGCAGIEEYGKIALFRSLAINSKYRNLDIGKSLTDKVMAFARENGIQELYLLTTTAEGFFLKQDWEVTDRKELPHEITGTSEFATICPSTAICMKYTF
jgi:amino-acid N-acetyltransferase